MKKLIALLCLSTALAAAPEDAAPVAAAAMRNDVAAVRALVKDGKDVNAAQGDGMTALHWAAMHGDAELTSTLLYAGANVKATTRLGGYTALHLAAQAGEAAANMSAVVPLDVWLLASAPDFSSGAITSALPFFAARISGV